MSFSNDNQEILDSFQEKIVDEKKDQISFKKIFNSLRRRKKIVYFTWGFITLITFVFVGYKRIFSPTYRGSFVLLISDPLDSKSKRGGSPQADIFESIAKNTTSNDIPTLVELLKSELILGPVALKNNLKLEGLTKRINIVVGSGKPNVRSFERAEGILKISVLTKKPKKEIYLIKDLSKAYLDTSQKQRQQRLTDGLDFLNKQEPILKSKTDNLQSLLVDFRKKYSLIEPSLEGKSIKTQQELMDKNINSLEIDANRLINIKTEIKAGNISALGFIEKVGDDKPGKGLSIKDKNQTLLDQFFLVESELAKAKAKYTATSSIVTSLKNRLNKIKPLIIENQLKAVDAAIKINSNNLLNLQRQRNKLSDEFTKQPQLIKEYSSIEQNLLIAEKNLAGLVNARENLQLQIAQSSVPWRIIEKPKISKKPIKPNIKQELLFGAFFGLAIGIILGLIRDRYDYVYYNISEIEDELNLPILGHIPYISIFNNLNSDQKSILDEKFSTNLSEEFKKERFFYEEAFRNLFTSLRFLDTNNELKIIALTSSIPSEGKSLTNILLAKTLHEVGQRILLIDADLRKPKINTRLGLNNIIGLSNVLTDQNLEIDSVIQNVPQFNNWDVITAGIKPPDPTRILGSERMKLIFDKIKKSKKYDYIIIDCPPVLGLADSLLTAEYADGIILLTSLGFVKRGEPQKAVSRIKESKCNFLGIVANEVGENMVKKYGDSYYGDKSPYLEYYDSETQSTSENKVENNKIYNKIINNPIIIAISDKLKLFYKWLED